MSGGAFTVGTWNMGGGEAGGGPTPAEARALLTELRELGCSVIYGQEAQEAGDREALEQLGYRVSHTGPESLVAWLPSRWKAVARRDEVLNPTSPFFRPGGSKPIYVRAARAILCDARGRSLDTLSYHLPSSVQQADAPERRRAALRESMERMAAIADESEARAVLFGGDDNVDEAGPFGPWGFMLRGETGLRQLRAPRSTLGRRKVDDFRAAGLVPLDDGRVVQGPTHHNAHVRRLGFRDAR